MLVLSDEIGKIYPASNSFVHLLIVDVYLLGIGGTPFNEVRITLE